MSILDLSFILLNSMDKSKISGESCPENQDSPIISIEQLKAENSKLKQLIDSLPVDVYWKDKEGIWEGANQRCLYSLKKMGIINKEHADEVIGKTDFQLFNQKTAEGYRKNDAEVMQQKKEISVEENTQLNSGEQITLLSIKIPVFDKYGQVSGILGNTIIEVTH
jgi:two-component system aerobic respiration control sensor histidine kinase ArcB